jgi:hypothetical protein
MKRWLVAVVVLGVLLVEGAAPTLAKGVDVVEGRAVIDGPGLASPIEIEGEVPLYRSGGRVSDLQILVRNAGLLPYELVPGGHFTLVEAAAQAEFGPGYRVEYFLEPAADVPEALREGFETSSPVVQTLYPYAPDGPMIFLHGDQVVLGQPVQDAWWVAPERLLPFLVSHGLPAGAPTTAEVPGSGGGQVREPSTGRPWLGTVGAAAILLALGAFAVLQRRRAGRA